MRADKLRTAQQVLILSFLAGCLWLGCERESSEEGPSVLSTSILTVDHTTALISARIDPTPDGSRYWCRYGRKPSAESLAVEGTLDASSVPLDVPVTLDGLAMNTRYYIKWRVEGEKGGSATALDTLQTLPANRAPDTFLTAAPWDTVGGNLLVHAIWHGYDPDGTTIVFDVALSEVGTEGVWTRTASTDSILSLTLGVFYKLVVRAVDDDGVVDPAPAIAIL